METDCIKVASIFNDSIPNCSPLNTIVCNIRVLCTPFASFSLVWKSRDGNMAAHNLAKVTVNCLGTNVWFDPLPSCILDVVARETP